MGKCTYVYQKCGHSCGRYCHDDDLYHERPCQVEITKEFECGHTGMFKCSDNSRECLEEVEEPIKGCPHIIVPCWEADARKRGGYKCKRPCTGKFEDCKHDCTSTCGDCVHNDHRAKIRAKALCTNAACERSRKGQKKRRGRRR